VGLPNLMDGLAPGTYVVTVTDIEGCTGSTSYEIEGGGIAKIDEAGCLINNILSRLSKAEVGDLARIFRKHKPKIASLRPDLKDAFRDASQHLSPKKLERLLDDSSNEMLENWAKLNKLSACPLSRSANNFCEASPPVTLKCDALRKFLTDFFEDTVGKAGGKDLIKKLEKDLIRVDGSSNDQLINFFTNPINVDAADVWKFLDDAGVDDSVRRNLDALLDPDAALDAIQASGKTKPSWSEIQALFKRGNDFNKKARTEYGDDYVEIVLKGVDGKPGKRLDTYLPPKDGNPGQIISRKATTLSAIKPSTFKSYLSELVNKY
jgi:hypothetical protein